MPTQRKHRPVEYKSTKIHQNFNTFSNIHLQEPCNFIGETMQINQGNQRGKQVQTGIFGQAEIIASVLPKWHKVILSWSSKLGYIQRDVFPNISWGLADLRPPVLLVLRDDGYLSCWNLSANILIPFDATRSSKITGKRKWGKSTEIWPQLGLIFWLRWREVQGLLISYTCRRSICILGRQSMV